MRVQTMIWSLMLLVVPAASTLAVPPLSYQGELREGGEVLEGTAYFKFAIVADGVTLWSNDGTSSGASEPSESVEVAVSAGIFSVLLGSDGMALLPDDLLSGVDDPLLRIWVDTGTGFEQLSDQPVASGAYALHSQTAERAPHGFEVGGELEVSGTIRVGGAGVEFPDGSVQATAATGEPSGTAGGALAGQYPNPSIAANTVVKSVNGFRDDVTFAAGNNVTLDANDGTITINSTATGGGAGVPSVNGIVGPVTMVGAGGAVVDTDGDTITITASTGGGEAGVQGIQSATGTLDVSDPVGPTVTVDVAPDAITETHLANDAVTSSKIDDATIRNQDIAANAAIAESKLALAFPTHSIEYDPTPLQKAALAGTSGSPSVVNPYVTDQDTRLDDARPPKGSARGDLAGTYPNPTIAPGKAVTSLNDVTDDVNLIGGSNVTVSTRGNLISISATGGGTGGGGSLDDAYDEGETITADSGPVHVAGTDGLVVEGPVGFGTTAQRAALDVRATDLGLPTSALQDETVVIEDERAVLGLYSQGLAAPAAPALVLARTAFGTLTEKWAIYRSSATESGLVISAGNNSEYYQNTKVVEFVPGGATVGSRMGVGVYPRSSLHVSSGNAGDAELILEADTDNNNESDNPFITFRQDGDAANAFIGLEGNASTRAPGTLNNALVIGSEDNDPPIQFITDDKLRMTIRETGLIGVGLNFPLQEFHVEGDIAVTGSARVGIGTTNPQTNLEVVGDIGVTGNGQVGIGTTSPEADLDVRGDVKWSPVTSYIMIHPAALVPKDNSPLPKYSISSTKGLHCLADISAPAFDSYTFLAPLTLPDRSRVTSFVFYHVDDESDSNITAKLMRRDLTGGTTTTMGEVTTSGSSSSVQTASDTSITGLDVDNSRYAYHVTVTIKEALEHYVTGFRIKYTTEGPY